MTPYYKTEIGKLYNSDCLEVLKTLPSDSIDSLITDPPAGITFMSKGWDSDKGGRNNWIAWLAEIMVECYRVLKPGATGLVWAIPRTAHWTATALEDAGFEIRSKIYHLFGSGFPKNYNIATGIESKLTLGNANQKNLKKLDGEMITRQFGYSKMALNQGSRKSDYQNVGRIVDIKLHTDEAKTWDGYGTALKPAAEEWIVVQKPNDGNYAENALKHGVAGINIDGCKPQGRWPANVILGDQEACDEVDEQSGQSKSVDSKRHNKNKIQSVAFGKSKPYISEGFADEGGASRFFYCSKPSSSEKNTGCGSLGLRVTNDGQPAQRDNAYQRGKTLRHNHHPTVKSLKLMKYLCKLTMTPTKGIVLDPFSGSGTTLLACEQLGRGWIGIEKEEGYCEIIKQRIKKEREQMKLW